MKALKLFLFTFLGLLTVEGFGQRSCQVYTQTYSGRPDYSNYQNYSYGSIHSKIGFYAHELRLNRRQARDFKDILNYYSDKIYRVERRRDLRRSSKRARIKSLLRDREYEIRDILSRRQYSKYRAIKNFDRYRRDNFSCPSHGNTCDSYGCYDSHYENRYDDGWDSYWNRDRQRNWDRNYGHHDRNYKDRKDNRSDDYYGNSRQENIDEDEYFRREGESSDYDATETEKKDLERADVQEAEKENEDDPYYADEVGDFGDEELDDYFADEN